MVDQKFSSSFLFGAVFTMIFMIFLMVGLLTFDYFSTKYYHPTPVHVPVCDDNYNLYYFKLNETPAPRMNSRERRRFCPSTLTPTYMYKSPTPTFDPFEHGY